MATRKKKPQAKKAGQKKTTGSSARSSSRRKKSAAEKPRTTRTAPRKRKKPPAGQTDRGGRPAIDWESLEVLELIEALAGMGNSVEDAAVLLGVSKSSLEEAIADDERPVRERYQRGKAMRRGNLRRAQTTTALGSKPDGSAGDGHPTLLMWLGKQELNQRDVSKLEVVGDEGGAVKVEGNLSPVIRRRLEEFIRSRKGDGGAPGAGS